MLATRRGTLPQESDVEAHVDDAYARCGKDATMRLDLGELEAWFLRRVEELGNDRGLEFCDSPTALLLCFDLVTASVLPDDEPAVELLPDGGFGAAAGS